MNDKEKTAAVIAWLEECFQHLEAGEEERIPSNLFYKSTRGILTDDYVDRMVDKIEAEFVHELTAYPAYHFRNAHGATKPPDFHRLSRNARRAMVEGLDRVLGYEEK